jgi:hypothetical protein
MIWIGMGGVALIFDRGKLSVGALRVALRRSAGRHRGGRP